RMAAVVSTRRLLCETLLGAMGASCEWNAKAMRTRIALQKQFVRNLRRRGLFSDADEDYRNSTRTGRHQRPTAPHASGRRHLAAYIPSAAASQLSALFLGAVCLS